MANSDKNIRITTSKNKTTYPNIVFTGSAAGSSVITLEVLDDNTLSFTSNEGQVFSIDSNLSTGTIWAVSDISGIPLLSASAGGTIGLGVYGGLVGIGQTNATYKLDLKGSFGLASSVDGLYNFIFSNSSASGSNSLQVRSANSLLLYNSGNTFYTGLKSNAAANVTYTLPTTDGSSGQFLQTNGSGTLSWATATGSGGTGSTAGVGQGGQYEMAYYPGTGLSVVGSNTFTNNTATGVVSITHTTASTDFSNGAFKVSGGVGIGGSLYVGGIGASIVGVTFSNSTITRGTWNGTVVSTTYGGTGQNLGSSTGILTISSGTVSASTTSSAIASALTDETGSGSLVFNSSPSFGTGVTTNSATFAVFNTTATTINAFGAATVLSIGASTGKATFNSTDNSTSSTTGGLVVSGGAGFAKSISVAGRLQLLNGANVTAFVSSGTGNTVYVLPATTPAIGTSVLQSDSIGNLSWVGISSGSGSATTATNIQISALGNVNSFHPVLLTPFQASSGSAVSANGTVVYNPSTDIFYTPGLAVTSGVDSSSTTTGALQVRGGIGVTGTGYFDVVRTRAIVTTGDVTIAGNLAVNGSTIDFGNATTDSISFIGRVDTSILPISNNLYDLGSPTLAYANASFGSSIYFTNTSNTNILAFTAGATGTTLTYVLPIDTPTAGQVLAASAISGGRVTLSWEDDQTGAPAGGITTLNTLTAASQSFSTGTSGSDFNISSVTSTHTFNIPDAGSSARGFVSTGTQTFTGAKTFSSAASITDATVSISTSSGALVVTGGVGIGGSLFVANPARFSSSTAAISVGTGALTVTGGAGIAGSLYAGGVSAFTSNAVSISTGTGALVVTGGVGIGGSVFTSTSVPSSISGVVLNNGIVTVGTWSGSLVTAFYGGTGFNSYTVGDLLVASTGTSLARLPASANSGWVLTSNGAGNQPTWQAVPPAAASSVAVAVTALDQVFYPTIVNTNSGSGLGLSTVNTIQINAARGTFAAVGISAGTAITVVGTAAAINTTTGALQVIGGVGIGGSLYAGGISNFSSNTASISTGTGALVVTGGVGIGGSLNVASPSSISGVILNTNYISATGGTFTTILQAATIRALAANTISFQTIDSSNAAQFNNVRFAILYGTASSSSGTGALVVSGGAGIGGSLFVASASQFEASTAAISVGTGAVVVTGGVGIGGSLYAGGASRFTSSTAAISSGTGALTVTGGAGIAGSLFVGSASRFESSTASIEVGTGALTVTGGVGIGGSLFVGGASRFTSTTAAISVGTGALTVSGGAGIAGSLYAGGISAITSNAAAISTGTGAFVVTGGVGIGGSIYVGGASRFSDSTQSTTTNTGALVVTGGAAVGQTFSVGGSLNIFNGANYAGFRFAGSANTTYTLPAASPATGSSVLQSTSAGVLSWVPMTSGGGPSGTINASDINNIAYYTASTTLSGENTAGGGVFQYRGATNGLNIANEDIENLPSASSGLLRIGSGSTDYAYRKALAVFSTVSTWTDGDLLILGVGGNGLANQKVGIDYRGYIQIGVPGTGFTLPVTNGTSGQVLTANTNGVASWTTVTGSSGAGSGTVAVPGAQYQVAAYYHSATGASVSGSTTFTNNTSTGVVEITHTTESTSTTSGAFQVDGGAGIAKSLFVGTTLSVGTTPSYNVPNNLASFVSTVNSYNQLVIQNKSNGTSASANLVVNNDVSTDAANYGEIGMNSSTFSGSGALNAANAVYVAAHTAPLVLGTVTAHPIRFTVNNGASDILYIAESGLAVSCFANFGLRSASDLRFWNSGNTFYAGIQGGNTSANYLLTLPSAPVGNGYSTIIVDSSGNMYFAPVEGGLAATSATGNRVVLRNKMEHHVWMAAGYTPLAAGPDNIIYVIPDSSEDGSTKITFRVTEFSIRVETPSAGSSRIQLEKSSTDTGAFTLAATGSSIIGGVGLTIAGAGIYVTTSNTFVAGTLVTSGNLLRLNWTLLNATHANFSVQFTLNEV